MFDYSESIPIHALRDTRLLATIMKDGLLCRRLKDFAKLLKYANAMGIYSFTEADIINALVILFMIPCV